MSHARLSIEAATNIISIALMLLIGVIGMWQAARYGKRRMHDVETPRVQLLLIQNLHNAHVQTPQPSTHPGDDYNDYRKNYYLPDRLCANTQPP